MLPHAVGNARTANELVRKTVKIMDLIFNFSIDQQKLRGKKSFTQTSSHPPRATMHEVFFFRTEIRFFGFLETVEENSRIASREYRVEVRLEDNSTIELINVKHRRSVPHHSRTNAHLRPPTPHKPRLSHHFNHERRPIVCKAHQNITSHTSSTSARNIFLTNAENPELLSSLNSTVRRKKARVYL